MGLQLRWVNDYGRIRVDTTRPVRMKPPESNARQTAETVRNGIQDWPIEYPRHDGCNHCTQTQENHLDADVIPIVNPL